MVRWRLFKFKKQFIEVWDTLEDQWEGRASNPVPPGELQFVAEDRGLESIMRLRSKVLNSHQVPKDSAIWLNLTEENEKEFDKLVLKK